MSLCILCAQIYSQAGRRILPSPMLGSPAVTLLWAHPREASSAKPERPTAGVPTAGLLLVALRNGELMVWDVRAPKQELKCSLAPLVPPTQGQPAEDFQYSQGMQYKQYCSRPIRLST